MQRWSLTDNNYSERIQLELTVGPIVSELVKQRTVVREA